MHHLITKQRSPLPESISSNEFPVAWFVFSTVNREWAKKSGETWTNREVPMNITALIFEQISGFNRKSTTRAATREGREREEKRRWILVSIDDFQFHPGEEKKKKRRGGRWKEKKMRPNGFQGERRSKDGGAKVRWSIWAIKRKWTHWCIKIFLIYGHESMFFSFRIHVPYVENRITRNTVISYTKENLTEIVFYQC